ncbi:ATP-grasp domain-containing protein [Caldifermentibacillus hisashii]|uniref:ATP-grasp domain-containing protein n=1 Tax=Caldifermentibacillus hisashii TaxID=996558 RepID=UPI0022B953F0|nr:ATP-grasp domain-containing protein [Caldifermentibacillus hisashii]
MDAIIELKKMGYETYACAMAKDGPGADVVDHFCEINILDIEGIINYIKENQISLVYSVGSDLAIPVASSISEKLKLPYFVSEKTARICNNKDLMRETLGDEFVGNVKFQVITNEKDKLNLEFPVIVKPADSQGQRGVKLVGNLEEYLEAYRLAKKYSRSGLVIVEQYISGPEISVNGYLVEGNLQFIVASDRETWPEYTGLIHKHIVPSVNLSSQSLIELRSIIESACNKLEIYNGPVYAQMKLEKDKPYIIEITPRLDGCHMWALLQYSTGINLLRLTFQHLLTSDLSELNKFNPRVKNMELEFFCQEPNTVMKQEEFHVPSNAVKHFFYYKDGEIIRSVNGKFEKVGYYIKNI